MSYVRNSQSQWHNVASILSECCDWDCPRLDSFQFKFISRQFLYIFAASPNQNLTKSFFEITMTKRKKDAEIQTSHTLSQQWKIESFSKHQKGSFSSHSISSAWRSPSVAGCSETEGHYWPWTQTVRWVRTIQPYIISLSQQSKETLTEKLRERTNRPEKVQGKDA